MRWNVPSVNNYIRLMVDCVNFNSVRPVYVKIVCKFMMINYVKIVKNVYKMYILIVH